VQENEVNNLKREKLDLQRERDM